MKTSIFLIIVLISGAFAGIIHGTVNFAIVEPYLDQSIGIENQNLFATGEEKDTLEFWVEYEGYRTWQKSGQILSGVILGTSLGALFGIVFILFRGSLPGNNDVKKAIVLAGIMWFTMFVIPFLKYPANPPTAGDPETVALRSILYISLITISGLGIAIFYKLSERLKNNRKLVTLISYGVFISIIFTAMPENPDKITAPENLVEGFRTMSFIGVTSFWVSLGVIFGFFCNRLDPHKETTIL